MNREERRQFVHDHRTCIFGYARKEHGPAMTVVYYVVAGGDLLVSTMAQDEHRVVIRVRPYATFETPPRHVYKMSDIDTLTHFTSTSLPW